MAQSTFLVGSHASVPTTTLTVVANGNSEDLTFPAGAYYVHDTVSARSAVDTLCTTLATHGDITTCTGQLSEDRLVRVTATGNAFTCAFDDDTLRNLLGLTGNWTSSSLSQAGDEPSGYLWVPDRPSDSSAPRDTQGLRVYDTRVGMAGPGQVTTSEQNYHTMNEFEWRFVKNARVWTTSEANGEWIAFYRNVLRRFYKFKHYQPLTNDEASTAAVNLGTPVTLGPYIMNPGRGDVKEDYDRAIPKLDSYLDHVSLDVVSTAEYA